jgi:hypothetical protein
MCGSWWAHTDSNGGPLPCEAAQRDGAPVVLVGQGDENVVVRVRQRRTGSRIASHPAEQSTSGWPARSWIGATDDRRERHVPGCDGL